MQDFSDDFQLLENIFARYLKKEKDKNENMGFGSKNNCKIF